MRNIGRFIDLAYCYMRAHLLYMAATFPQQTDHQKYAHDSFQEAWHNFNRVKLK